MRRSMSAVLGALVAAGCSAGGGANLPSGDLPPGAGLELVVENERQTTMTAFVEWRGSRGVRLGEVRARESRMFTTPMRGRDVRVTFGSLGASATSGRRIASDFIAVSRGDRVEWTLTFNGVFFRRLVPD